MCTSQEFIFVIKWKDSFFCFVATWGLSSSARICVCFSFSILNLYFAGCLSIMMVAFLLFFVRHFMNQKILTFIYASVLADLLMAVVAISWYFYFCGQIYGD